MSIVLKSTSGGQVTLQEPTTASNFTANLPAATGDVMVSGNMPAFSVFTTDSSGYFNSSISTKVRFNGEIFDTNNCFDPTTNYRFTPNVAGYYHFTVKILNNFAPPGQLITHLYKNGGGIAEFSQMNMDQQGQGVACSYLAYANGTTDYFEIYYYQDKGNGLSIYTGGQQTFWVGHMVRGA